MRSVTRVSGLRLCRYAWTIYIYQQIILNAAIIFIELRFEYEAAAADAGQAGFTVTWWEGLELAFTFIYNLEMVVKMVVHGFRRYWKTWRNCFDGSISLVRTNQHEFKYTRYQYIYAW